MTDGSEQSHGEQLRFGPFCLSPGERLITRNGEPIDIGGRSFDLLVALASQPGRVLSKRELLKRVWSDVAVEDGSLRFHMAGLRKLLGEGENGARYIATQVGVGYAFVATVERDLPLAGALTLPVSASVDGRLSPFIANSSIPPRLDRLIGREKDLSLLLDKIVDTQLFTIVGPAGVGKTALGVEIAYQLAERFENRVTFVDLGMLEDAALVPQTIAAAMGLAVQGDDPLAVILAYARDQQVLLLLDNCEHVIGAVSGIVERIAEAAPRVRIIATSREALRIRGERVHRLEALSYPDDDASLTVQQLFAYPALQLFWERAVAGGSSMEAGEGSARLIAEMCRRLDGMAFPIELAAVRAATHGIPATARLLGERFSLGWSGHRTAAPRQQTLQSMLDWSYDLLTGVEQTILERLAIFTGPFSIDAALEVAVDSEIGTSEVAAAVDALTSKSLVVPDRSGRTATYRLLEMTRAHAREKLRAREDGQYDAAARRHAAYFLAELHVAAQQGDDAPLDSRTIRQQLGNIRGALEWSFGARGDLEIAVQLVAASARVFLEISSLVECRAWCTRAIAELQDAQRETAVELELQASLGIALMFTRGNSEAAATALFRALEVATRLEDRWYQLRILGRLHVFHERLGENSKAFLYAEQAIEVAKSIGSTDALGIAYSLPGISFHLSGDQRRARSDLEFSLANIPRSGRDRILHYGFDPGNRCRIALARTLWLTGDAARAVSLAEQAVSEAATLNHPATYCIALIGAVSTFCWAGELEKADRMLETFAKCAEANALGPYIVAAHGFRGEIARQRGRAGEAIEALDESLSRLHAARYELLTTTFSISLTQALIDEERYREARDFLDAAIGHSESTGERLARAELLRIKATIVRQADRNPDLAEGILRESLALSQAQGSRAWELRSAVDLAELMFEPGKREEAVNMLTGVRAHFAKADTSVDVRRADKLLAALRN